MARIPEIYESTPFATPLVDSGFRSISRAQERIRALESNPNVIIRIDDTAESELKERYKHYIDTRNVLSNLQTQYGISVPQFSIVLSTGSGEHSFNKYRFYMVTERIHGPNLTQRKFKKGEIEEATRKLSMFYSSLTHYIIDSCKNGGLIIGDLTVGVGKKGIENGNNQWVYGKIGDDPENKVWLADLGPASMHYYPYDSRFFQKQFVGLLKMIEETEEKLGCTFSDTRERISDYLYSAQKHLSEEGEPRNPQAEWALNELNQLLFFQQHGISCPL